MHGIIENIDIIESIEQSWHGLTKVKPQAELNEFEGSSLDWPIKRIPLCDSNGNPLSDYIIKGDSAEKRFRQGIVTTLQSGEEIFLTEANDSYPLVENEELFKTFEILIREFGFDVYSVGSIFGRKRIFWTLTAPEGEFEVKSGDSLKTNLNIVSSHDKTMLTRFYNSSVRIVCNNTMQFSLKDAKEGEENFFESLRKTKNVANRIAEVRDSLVQYYSELTEYKEACQALNEQDIHLREAKAFIAGLVGNKKPKADELTTRSMNQIEEITELFCNGKGNTGQTKWDLLNGFTEYYTHGSKDSKKSEASTWISSEFGTYADKKAEVFNILLDSEKSDEVSTKGEKLLELA